MKINKLQIEPHIVKPDTTKEHYVSQDGVVLWQVWVDGEHLTQTCYPLDKKYDILQLFTDPQFPMFTDGSGYLSVRKIRNHIIWCSLFDENDPFAGNSPSNFLSIFPVVEFDSVYQVALAKTLQLDSRFQNINVNESWQEISGEEILTLVKRHFPRDTDETAIYLEPHNPQDTTGKFFMRKMKNALKEITEFATSEPPEKQIELRIGLDEDEFTEAIWHIGKVNGQFAIYFEQHPSFPVWLQSSVFDKVLSQEPFNQDV